MARSRAGTSAVPVVPGPEDREPAAAVLRLARGTEGELVLATADGAAVPLPEVLVRLLVASAGELAEGRTVTLLPAEMMLTPAEVGELLGLSRPFVARLLDQGEIPSEHLPRSRHRRVRLSDVLAFQERRSRRREGRQRVAKAIEEAELPY